MWKHSSIVFLFLSSFVISGWGAGNSVPLKDDRKFGLELEFTYTDGTKEAFMADFASDSNQWQYVNKAVVAKKDYTSIKASYVYDTDNNITKITTPTGAEFEYTYDLYDIENSTSCYGIIHRV